MAEPVLDDLAPNNKSINENTVLYHGHPQAPRVCGVQGLFLTMLLESCLVPFINAMYIYGVHTHTRLLFLIVSDLQKSCEATTKSYNISHP